MLRVSNLSFAFNNHPLFCGLSFEVAAGQLLHIIGSNGAGKSTLLKVLTGLLSPSHGIITWQPQVVREYLAADNNAHYLDLDAIENLKFWNQLTKQDFSPPHIEARLDKWQLPQIAIRNRVPVKHFSTGMKRKLALARLNPGAHHCWIVDEPFLGLDVNAGEIFANSIKQHLTTGGSCILVSHEVRTLGPLISQTLSLESGRDR